MSPYVTLSAALLLVPAPGDAGGYAQERPSAQADAPDLASEGEAMGRRLLQLEADLRERPGDLSLRRERLHVLYFLSVEDESRIAEAARAARSLRSAAAPSPGSSLDGALDALSGALDVLRAKHATWPPERIRRLRDGLAALDRAVEAHPRSPEVRFLRIVSTFFLPFPFSRKHEVRRDMDVLTGLLAGDGPEDVPSVTVAAAAVFLLGHGSPGPDARQRLASLLEVHDG